jgi:alpha-tubulin suppressor-like RCC1 family protein/outer membrane protein assembly factor BamB
MNLRRRLLAACLLLSCCPAFAAEEGDPGTEKWTTDRMPAALSSPALSPDQNVIYVGGGDGRLYVFDAESGEPAGTENLKLGRGQCFTPAVAPDGTVYVALTDGSLVAVTNSVADDDSVTYAVKWRVKSERPMVGSPMIDADGVVYVGSRDHRLRAIRPEDGTRKWMFNAGTDITSSPFMDADGNIVVAAGRKLFAVSPSGDGDAVFSGHGIVGHPVAADDGRIYLGGADKRFYAVLPGGGSDAGTWIWRREVGAVPHSSPVIGVTGNIFFGSDNRRVTCVNSNGALQWTFSTRGAVSGPLAIGADGTIYVGSDDRRLYAITSDGRQKWTPVLTGGGVRSQPVIDGVGTVYFTSADRRLYAVYDNPFTDDGESPWPGFRRDQLHGARSFIGSPFIQVQPVDVTITNSTNIQFTVVAGAGAAMQYQWFLNGEEIDSAVNRTATNATLRLSRAQVSDEGVYSVEVFNDFGTATSDGAELSVQVPPQITANLSNIFINAGNTLRLNIGALGELPLTYVWRFNGATIAGEGGATLVISNIQDIATGAYDVTVSNLRGSTQSRTCIVTVVTNILTLPAGDSITAGARFSAAVLTNALFTWGADESGQLADSGAVNRNSATRVTTNFNWLLVSGGGRGNNSGTNIGGGHALALRTDGSLWAWGTNSSGQLGDGTTTLQRAPVRVGSDTNWVYVEAGAAHSVALRRDGTVWTWGANDHGQLGHGTTTARTTPAQVGADSAWAEVRAGGHFTLARRVDGTIWGWGRNESAQLGNNTTSNALAPVQIGTNTDWAAVSAGARHAVGLRGDGTLWNWGRNFGLISSSHLDDSTNVIKVPVRVGSESNWAVIDAGVDHSIALNNLAEMFTWGANDIGQLGGGISGSPGATNNANLSVPARIATNLSWNAISAGAKHSLARATDGTLWSWGLNVQGQGGDNASFTNHKVPVLVIFTNLAPVILQQPTNLTVTVTSNATFAVGAVGASPMTIRWWFNVTNHLAAETNATLVITNSQSTNAGSYSVVISNLYGSVTSSPAALTVLPFTNNPPGFSQQPANLAVAVGGTATFSVTVTGAAPIVLRWRFNTADITGATNSTLTITNAQMADAGFYSVIATNSFGSVTSVLAVLEVTNSAGLGAVAKSGTGRTELLPVVLTVSRDDNATVLRVQSGGRPFVIEYIDSLSDTNWRPLRVESGVSGGAEVRDAEATPARFYRARVP